MKHFSWRVSHLDANVYTGARFLVKVTIKSCIEYNAVLKISHNGKFS